VVTDAELDHTLGIALLREARALQVYATQAVRMVLEEDSRILPVTRAFADVTLHDLPLEQPVPLRYRSGEESGLIVTAFPVPGDAPRFARQETAGHTVGLVIQDGRTGGSVGFVPGCGALAADLLQRFSTVDLLLFDGTFWTDDELLALGISDLPARAMGHLPISGPGGSLERLAALNGGRRVYTHINNSNPMLIEDSPERAAVLAARMVVGDDGMRFTV
jgi:pyrroloquinoline quinone biosynthesis protein B